MSSLLDRDEHARALGVELVDETPGTAVVRMRVRGDMVNVHGTCHGGLVFSLADIAFELACNGVHGDDVTTVAAAADIEFLAPAAAGAVLTATCTERIRQGRTGVYDADVVDESGTTIAVFRGRSRTTGPVSGGARA